MSGRIIIAASDNGTRILLQCFAEAYEKVRISDKMHARHALRR